MPGLERGVPAYLEAVDNPWPYLEVKDVVVFLLSQMSPRARRVVEQRWLADRTLEETGKIFRISGEQVRKIEVEAFRQVRALILKLFKHEYWPL